MTRTDLRSLPRTLHDAAVPPKPAQPASRLVARLTAPAITAALPLVLREVIDAFVDAYVNDDDPRSGILLARFVLKHRVEPSEWTRAVVAEELDGMALRFISALGRAAPHLTEAEVHWRYHLMVGAILMTLSDETTGARIARLSQGKCRPEHRAQFRARMVDFLVSAFGPTPGAPQAAAGKDPVSRKQTEGG